MTQTPATLRIDIDKVLKSRAPKIYRFLPRFIISALERLICQQQMNIMLEKNIGKEGAEFCRGVLEHLDITYKIEGIENLPPIDDASGWRVIFAANHPLGGLDGMTLIDFLAAKAPGHDIRFIVNDLLMNIVPLQGVFLPVNTVSGKQTREGAQEIDKVMRSYLPIAIFPAGLCSRLIDGRVQDMQWNKMFINKAIEYQRNIIPIYFKGLNSGFFYKFAKLRKISGIPVNLEMSLLPREVFKNRGAEFIITIGKPIEWQSLKGGRHSIAEAREIREKVYSLRK